MNEVEIMMSEFVKVKFPKLNKQGTLDDNDRSIVEHGYHVENAKVMKTIEVPYEVYESLGNTLMEDNSLWEEIGGAFSDDARLDGLDFYKDIVGDSELMKVFKETMYTPVVKVSVKGNDKFAPFYVNTEGYKYARYVGRELGQKTV